MIKAKERIRVICNTKGRLRWALRDWARNQEGIPEQARSPAQRGDLVRRKVVILQILAKAESSALIRSTDAYREDKVGPVLLQTQSPGRLVTQLLIQVAKPRHQTRVVVLPETG